MGSYTANDIRHFMKSARLFQLPKRHMAAAEVSGCFGKFFEKAPTLVASANARTYPSKDLL